MNPVTVHITVINIKVMKKFWPGTLTVFSECYFTFLHVKRKFPNAGQSPVILPCALALLLGWVWNVMVHCNWWFFWACPPGDNDQGWQQLRALFQGSWQCRMHMPAALYSCSEANQTYTKENESYGDGVAQVGVISFRWQSYWVRAKRDLKCQGSFTCSGGG